MTHSPLSPHLAFIHQRLPTWLTQTSTPQRQTLERRIRRSHAASRRVAETLAPLEDIEAFCRPLLEQALGDWFADTTLPAVDQGRVLQSDNDHSWLEAALQNFDSGARPTLLDAAGATQRSTVDVDTFVKGVRNLDLGQRYRDHLADQIDTDAFREQLRQHDHAAFAAALSLAHLQGRVKTLGASLGETVVSGMDDAARRELHCSFLSLFGIPLNGPMLIHLDPSRKVDICLLYLPGHPSSPLRQYDSQPAAVAALTERLWKARERQFFTRYVDLASQPRFAAQLRAILYPRYPYAQMQPSPPVLEKHETFSWIKRAFPSPKDIWQETLDKNARLRFTVTPWAKDAFVERARTQVERRLQDAASLVVPTAQRDALAQLARIEGWLGVGLTVLNVAGFFLPGLGELMLVVGGAQLVDEFLEGVHSANEGDADAAIHQLFDVFENLVQFAALGTAARFSEPVDVLQGWHQVGSPGQERLWHGGLAPFARARPWPEGHTVGSKGLYDWQGQQWLERDALALPLEQADGGTLHLAAAEGHRHRPSLLGDGQGRWLLEQDRPLAWPQDKLLRHLGPLGAGLEPAALDRALIASGYDANRLRQTLANHHPLPALLIDTLEALGAHSVSGATPEPALANAITRVFPTLSRPVRAEILTQAAPRDLNQLQRTGRLPLRMAESARLYVRESRISKALARFHQTSGSAADRDALALGALQRLPGWTGEVRIEIREARLGGPLQAAAGKPGQPAKVLARTSRGYTAYDEHGLELAGDSDLFRALLQALPDSERDALGVRIGEAGNLRDKLFEQAAGDRRRAASDLGMAPVRPLYRLPSLLPGERRLGYRLSGGARGWVSDDDLFNQLFPPTPTDDREMLRLRLRYQAGDQPGAFGRLLTRMRADYRLLDFELQRWVHDPEGVSVAGLEQRRTARQALAQRLRSAWRREPTGDPSSSIDHVSLLMEVHQLDSLPRIPVRLPHVRQLAINGLSDPHAVGLEPLLRAFPGVRHLDLAQNALNRLPATLADLNELQSLDLSENNIDLDDTGSLAVIGQMPHLRRLNLTEGVQDLSISALEGLARLPALSWFQADSNELALGAEHFQVLQRWPALRGISLGHNAIVLDEAGRAALARLSHLEALLLQENPLSLAPDVTGWSALQQLDLESTGISQWPEGLTALMNQRPLALRQFDLSNNTLTEAPDLRDSAFARSVRDDVPDIAYSLNDNPFSEAARLRLEDAGLQTTAPGRGPIEWSSGWPAELQIHLSDTAEDPQWQALYELFDRLMYSADYQRSADAMRNRMQQVVRVLAGDLETMQASSWGRAQLQQQIDDLLRDAGQQCVDQASLLFQQVETDVQVWQAVNHAMPGMTDEAVAVEAAGSLYRQRLLDARVADLYQARVARRRFLAQATDDLQRQAAPPRHPDDDIADSALTEPDYLLDELEIALHARMQLRGRLRLPAQPGEIRFAYLARLSEATLQRLAAGVEGDFDAPRLGQWAVAQPFWQAWLRRLSPQDFESLARTWEGASEYFDALGSAGGLEGNYTGPPVPDGFINALQREMTDVPGLAWRRHGITQRYDLTAARFAHHAPTLLERVGGVLLRARQDTETALLETLTNTLVNAHVQAGESPT
ncbi:dermonecrotic toxin domain-containing protein [Pseudomonas entomophila]|uniref:RING-type E3 ubiquitin transferase n=2 Tax=Pseudomonas entomophila TaxID=312306 RepID=Q1ICC1_PSEE4|nr:DUF6543 domain-containing protein [Pseudomonas entomophila]WMW04509.1 NEL-type E3 ubiquitin ligase domain-containing protein [Pseudomonas entomophila]CAK14692.1 Hypothetical protein; LRR-domain containing protein [Pseudomonas entomophila L48]